MRVFRRFLTMRGHLFFTIVLASRALAERGVLPLHVTDVKGQPISGRVEIGVLHGGGTGWTLDDGRVLIHLDKETQEHTFVLLKIFTSPPGKDYAILSPYDFRVEVPPFAEKAENYQAVTLVQRGDRVALASGNFKAAITAQVNREYARRASSAQGTAEDPKASLEVVAKMYGFTKEDLDRAIRSWTPDPGNIMDSAQKALFNQNYPQAEQYFEQGLNDSLRVMERGRAGAIEFAYFLGFSRWKEGKYEPSAEAYKQCVALDPMEAACLNNEAASLTKAGRTKEAIPLLSSALVLGAAEFGPDSVALADYESNLGVALFLDRHLKEAADLHEKALKIRLARLGPNDSRVALSYDTIAEVLEAEGNVEEAAGDYQKAIAIETSAQGKDSVQLAVYRNNLGGLLRKQKKFDEAEAEFREALRIDQAVLPADHPDTAIVMDNVAGMAKLRGNRAEAEELYRKSIDIKRKVLAANDPALALALNNLGVFLSQGNRNAEAESSYREALKIYTDGNHSDTPDAALTRFNLAICLEIQGNFAEAHPLLKEALEIDQNTLGPTHPRTVSVGRSLKALEDKLATAAKPQ